MKFLLKIVQGPNAGAEIALVEGVRVTLGSADSCDIVLADPTLPAEACALEASADAVVLAPSGAEPETLAPLQVRSFGTTALAVGPADAPWGPLVWEAPSRAAEEAREAARSESAPEAPGAPGDSSAPSESSESSAPGAPSPSSPRRRGLRLLGLVALLLLLLLAAWLLARRVASPDGPAPSGPTPEASPAETPAGVTLFETNGLLHARGDFATRAERLAATAALYEAHPGIALDLADRETLLTATADLLQAATDGALQVSDVTNRVAVLAGRVSDPDFLRATLEALRTDVPRLSGADTAAVALDSPLSAGPKKTPGSPRARQPRLPLRCILLQPYPCIVLQDGQRLFEGADVGGFKISKITFDRIAFRNEAGEELEWTP